MAVKYMHTLNSEPAYFDGKQIVYRPDRDFRIPLVGSVQQIIDEQAASQQYRQAKGYHEVDGYSYVAVETG